VRPHVVFLDSTWSATFCRPLQSLSKHLCRPSVISTDNTEYWCFWSDVNKWE
jgi:hypothetical protein